MNDSSLVKWLFERKAVFAALALIAITVLCAIGRMGDGVFAGCFTALVGAFFTASVVADKVAKEPT